MPLQLCAREVEDVKTILKNTLRGSGKGACLLVGAGCSLTAGIPTSDGFVEKIKKDYPEDYERASKKEYPEVMNEIPEDHRRNIVAAFVREAKINWAHLCIARLIQTGYVDRVLTTNFDNLIIRACALLGVFPAVYDCATSKLLDPGAIPDKAIFHLHGQHTGLLLIITPQDFKQYSKLLKPVFRDAGMGRTWIIVGYSGKNDPVFEQLAKMKSFTNNLYWVGYLDHPPEVTVQDKLLKSKQGAFYVKNYDADCFFIKLAQELKIFPPEIIGRPFSHLAQCFERIAAYPICDQSAEEDVTHVQRKWIDEAIRTFEFRPELAVTGEINPGDPGFSDSLQVAANTMIMSGDNERVAETLARVDVISYKESLKKELKEIEEKSDDMVREVEKKFKKDKDNAEL